MADTNTGDVAGAIQTFWPSVFMKELVQKNRLYTQVNRDYDGDIKDAGDTVKVNQINTPTGQTLTIDGAGAERTFTAETMSLTTKSVVANKRFTASFDIDDTVSLQSLVDPFGPKAVELRGKLLQAVMNQMNTYIYSLFTGATAQTGQSTMTAALMKTQRVTAGTNKWGTDKPWYGNLSPNYWGDCLVDSTLSNSDFTNQKILDEGPAEGVRRFGFELFEDNTLTNTAYFFHPDAIIFVLQLEPRFQIASQLAAGKFANFLVCDIIGGGVTGIQNNLKYTKITVA